MATMMEVPEAVRDFAIKSVDQAERAFNGFVEAAHKSMETLPAPKLPEPMQDMSKTALDLTENSIKAAFDYTRQLVKAKDVQEVIQIQTEYFKSQLALAQEQMKKFAPK